MKNSFALLLLLLSMTSFAHAKILDLENMNCRLEALGTQIGSAVSAAQDGTQVKLRYGYLSTTLKMRNIWENMTGIDSAHTTQFTFKLDQDLQEGTHSYRGTLYSQSLAFLSGPKTPVADLNCEITMASPL